MSEPTFATDSREISVDSSSFADLGAPSPTILVVDDEEIVLRALERLLRRAGAKVIALGDGLEAAAAVIEEGVEVALVDIRMPHIDGLSLLKQLKKVRPDVEVVMITAYATIETAVRAIKLGAYDYLTKPFEDVAEVVAVVHRALERFRLSSRNKELEEALETQTSFEGLVGGAPALRQVFEMIDSVAYSSSTVLIQGESGTGKELVAKAIHRRSPRKNGPFVAINCNAVPETLLESELFGHVKGAFTGATTSKRGLFEAAGGGTIFLDEIGDLPLSVQGKLLRVLQEGEVRHVGSNDTRRVDARVAAATNMDLDKARGEKRFREDLYYRLNVIPIHVPPLRDRAADIPVLAHHFLRRLAARDRKRVEGFTKEAMRGLCGHSWPGNVRELENVVERALVLCRADAIGIEHLPGHLAGDGPAGLDHGSTLCELPYAEAKELALSAFDKRYLEATLRRSKGNITKSAQIAGMDRSNFRRILRRHEIDAKRFAPQQ